MKKSLLLLTFVFAGTAAYAQTAPTPAPTPAPTTPGPHRGAFAGHPELRKAEVHTHEAVAELTKAQENNHWDMEGHAAKARRSWNRPRRKSTQSRDPRHQGAPQGSSRRADPARRIIKATVILLTVNTKPRRCGGVLSFDSGYGRLRKSELHGRSLLGQGVGLEIRVLA